MSKPKTVALAATRVPGDAITKPGGRKPPRARSVSQAKRPHVAPRRLTDGIKADHAARTVAIDSVFPRRVVPLPMAAEEVAP